MKDPEGCEGAMNRRMRRGRARKGRVDRRARILSATGWAIALLGLLGYIANEATVDLPPVHYGMYAVMFAGAYLGFHFLP